MDLRRGMHRGVACSRIATATAVDIECQDNISSIIVEQYVGQKSSKQEDLAEDTTKT